MEGSSAAAIRLDLGLADVDLAVAGEYRAVVVTGRFCEGALDSGLVALYASSFSAFFDRDGFLGWFS